MYGCNSVNGFDFPNQFAVNEHVQPVPNIAELLSLINQRHGHLLLESNMISVQLRA